MVRIEVEKSAVFTGHRDCVYVLEKSGEKTFFSSGADGMVVQWNNEKPDMGEMIIKVPNSVYALEFVESLDLLVVGQNFAGVHLIDLKSNKEMVSAAITNSSIFDIKKHQDIILVGTGSGEVKVLNFPEFQTVANLNFSDKSARSISVSLELGHFAVGYSDNKIRIFNLKDFSLLKTIDAHDNSVFSVQYSPDSKYLLSGSRDAHLKIWNTAQEYVLQDSVVAHMYAINHVAFRNDGKYFATCSMDKSIKVWRTKDFRLLKVIDKARHAGHGTSVNKLIWSEDGKIISCSDDRTISVWNFKNL